MVNTVTVKRGGSYLTISPLAIDRYIAKGYDVVDDEGNILQTGIPNDVNVLKRAYDEHIKEIQKLKEEIAYLKGRQKEDSAGTEEPEDAAAKKKTAPKPSKKSV